MAETWMRGPDGTKALIGDTDRDDWTSRSWVDTLAPVDGDFLWMSHPDVADPGRFPWEAREVWQAKGWQPSAPPAPIDPTRDPAPAGLPPEVAEGSVTKVLEWVGDDRERAEQALVAERTTRPQARTTLVDSLNRVGQPADDAAAAAQPKEA